MIKIEGPADPDVTRRLGPNPVPEEQFGLAAMYVTANRGKRCLALDLRQPEGVAVLKHMAAHSDVVLQNFRPGVAEKLGIGYDDLKANKNLVYLSISGYGPTGPYAEAKVYDFIVQAQSGVGEIMKDADGGPTQFHNLSESQPAISNLSCCRVLSRALFLKDCAWWQ